MANSILTPDQITKEALRVLHEKLSFVGNINKQYDSSFAREGAKIGDSLRIKKPAKFTVRDGATMNLQDFVQTSVSLNVDKQKGIDLSFSDADLTLSLDNFSADVIEPAMAQLASAIEEDVLKVAQGQSVVTAASESVLFKAFLTAQANLDNLTTPRDASRCVLVDTLMQVDLVDDLKGLFQDSNEISKQYKEGIMGRTGGATWYQSSRIPTTVASPEASFAIVALGEGTITLTFTGAGTLEAGTTLELDTGFAVHPETKKVFAGQKVYVTIEEDVVAAGAGNETAKIANTIISAPGARQNISAAPVNAVALSADAIKSLVFHKDFMTIATADLVLPKGTDMASRQVFDGISMRLVRDFQITDGSYPVRLDVLYGKKVLRPEYGGSVIKGY